MKTVSTLLTNPALVAVATMIVVGLLASPAGIWAQTSYPPPEQPMIGTREDNWRAEHISLISGNPSQGRYPSAVVVLSETIYNLPRDANCMPAISGLSVRSQRIFDYLKVASRNGVRVIIRISPSPGNFDDVINHERPHNLLYLPGQLPYGAASIPCGQRASRFRTVDDVALEIKILHAYNQINGLHEFGFEPANEPNKEWYEGIPDSDITIKKGIAWSQMDLYFAQLYDQVHPGGANPDIRLLTPPMAQFRYAEPRMMVDCYPMSNEIEGGLSGLSGYDRMPNTFGYAGVVKNDGYTWHNYWAKGRETWAPSDPCAGGTTNPVSNHIVQFFPGWLQARVNSSVIPAIITEADLLSPCIALGTIGNGGVQDKDQAGGADAANSLRNFIAQENSADIVISWLLTTQYSDATLCTGDYRWYNDYCVKVREPGILVSHHTSRGSHDSHTSHSRYSTRCPPSSRVSNALA